MPRCSPENSPRLRGLKDSEYAPDHFLIVFPACAGLKGGTEGRPIQAAVFPACAGVEGEANTDC